MPAQVLLAWGLGGLDVWVLAGLAASTAASLVMAAGTNLANGVPDCQAFCAQPIPVVGATISSWNVWLAADGSLPYLAGSLCNYMVVQIVQFAAPGFTTGLFLVKAGRRVNSGALVMSLVVAAAYVAGIVCSIVGDHGSAVMACAHGLCLPAGLPAPEVFDLGSVRQPSACSCGLMSRMSGVASRDSRPQTC